MGQQDRVALTWSKILVPLKVDARMDASRYARVHIIHRINVIYLPRQLIFFVSQLKTLFLH